MKKAIMFSVMIFLALSLLSLAGEVEKQLKNKGLHVAELSETDKINLKVNKLQQAIQQQWIEEIVAMLSEDYAEIDPSITLKSIREEMEGIFSFISQTRGISSQTNPETGWKVTATKDFYIQNVNIDVKEEKAIAECEVGFHSAGKDYKNIKETLSFVLKDHVWLLAGSKNLFGFLKQASKTTKEKMGTPYLSGEILRGTKEDLTSTHMLIPVNLLVYDGDPIPRFNRAMSYQYFSYYDPFHGMQWINIMNFPYGIVADVQYTPGSSDLTHEFLFITDVTADKIVGAQLGDWIAEYGTEGGDIGQFQGPHGICNMQSLFLIADRFNNRVIAYQYEKGMDDPRHILTLSPGFNEPIDVEGQYKQHTEPPQESERLAVVDFRNHRLAFFLFWPYTPGTFDRFYGEYGSGGGQFISPTSVCFGRDSEIGWSTDDVFVTDRGNHRLVRLYITSESIIWRGSYQFPPDVDLTSVDVDNKGLVYVVDECNGKVYKFSPSQSGNFSLLGIWGEKGMGDGQLFIPSTIQVAHGRNCPHPDPCYPLNNLGDVFVTEAWSFETGVRRFVIAADVLNLAADWVPYNEDTGEGNFIWWEYHLTDFATITEQVLRGAEVCTTYNRGILNYGFQGGAWPVDGHPHGADYTVKITASSKYEPTIVIEKSVDVYVDTFTTHDPIITRGIRCHWIDSLGLACNYCWECLKEWHGYRINV
jgi:hypothetical protein